MTVRIVSTSSPAWARARALAVVLAATSLGVAGCSAVGPSANNQGSTGGAAAGSGAAGADSFGTPANPDEVKQGGSLVMALSAEPDKLDPALSRSLYSRYIFNAMCEKLYDVDQSAKIVPQLATALPTISGDGKTATAQLQVARGSNANLATGTMTLVYENSQWKIDSADSTLKLP